MWQKKKSTCLLNARRGGMQDSSLNSNSYLVLGTSYLVLTSYTKLLLDPHTFP